HWSVNASSATSIGRSWHSCASPSNPSAISWSSGPPPTVERRPRHDLHPLIKRQCPRVVASTVHNRRHRLGHAWPRYCARHVAIRTHVFALLGVLMTNWKEEAEKAWDSPSWKEAAREAKGPMPYDAKPSSNQTSSLAQILDDVYAFLGRFVIYPSKEAHAAHALWIAHAHVMDAWESTPRIAFLSPEPASGKTRALEVSELLVPNPVEAINVSAAYIFRKVGDHENGLPTILHDEIDTLFGPKAKENEDIRGFYNAGHRRGAVAGRCALHGKKVVPEEIPAFSALSLAGLGWLPDTILSRSIVIRMRRRAPNEKITPFRRRVYAKEGN